MELEPDRSGGEPLPHLGGRRLTGPEPHQPMEVRAAPVQRIEAVVVEPGDDAAADSRGGECDLEATDAEVAATSAAHVQMRIDRLEADPQPVIRAFVVVPAVTVGDRAFERQMILDGNRITDGEARAGGLEVEIVKRLLPSVESEMKRETCAREPAAVSDAKAVVRLHPMDDLGIAAANDHAPRPRCSSAARWVSPRMRSGDAARLRQ
jgi:hypothetical protein